MSFRSRLAYVSRGKINFCAVKFRAAALLLSRSPSYLLSYCSVFSNALEFRQSYVLMQNLSTYRGLWWMKFYRSPQAVRGICLSCMRVTAQRGFFVSVVRFAYRVYASWTSIRLPRAVAARPPRYAYFCAVSYASPHLRQDRAVPLKHANLSCIKFRFFAVLASCRTLSYLSAASRRRLISQPHLPRIIPRSLQVLAPAS